MKQLFFTIALATCLFSLLAMATDKNLPDVLKSFYQTFQNAQNVNWTEVDDMLRIGFTVNCRQQFAYYSNDELVVVAKEIKSGELPQGMKAQLSAYKGFNITQVYELNKNNAKEYCAVMDSPSKHIVLKGKNKWKVYIEEAR